MVNLNIRITGLDQNFLICHNAKHFVHGHDDGEKEKENIFNLDSMLGKGYFITKVNILFLLFHKF